MLWLLGLGAALFTMGKESVQIARSEAYCRSLDDQRKTLIQNGELPPDGQLLSDHHLKPYYEGSFDGWDRRTFGYLINGKWYDIHTVETGGGARASVNRHYRMKQYYPQKYV